jgi:hypothetical protein
MYASAIRRRHAERTKMSDLTFALRHSERVYNDLNEHSALTIDALRAAYRHRHPNESCLRQRRWVIETVARKYPVLLRSIIATLNRPDYPCSRRSSPIEGIKGLTHGFEYAGQVSGGNFGASF